MLRNTYNVLILIVLILSCEKPFSQTSETTLALAIEPTNSMESIVFIGGYDEGDNTYYSNAKNYFEAQKMEVINGLYSINEIIMFLNEKTTKTYNEIHIVSHSNPWLGMSLKTIKDGERITIKTLHKAKSESEIQTLKSSVLNTTKIIFHSCGLGDNKALLQSLKGLFITDQEPKVIASSYFNVFGGKYAGHYLAKPYYGYYPTAESQGPAALSKEFKVSYPETNIDWFTALKTRQETTLGEVYSYKFNIPVDWEFTFDDKTEIPELKGRDAIMDWVSESPEMSAILYNLNIHIEKYRWRSKTKGNKLFINGKTTVLCVLKPILQENDATEYKSIELTDDSLYQVL